MLHVFYVVRDDLAHRLLRHGPMFFMSLTENEILQLVELLITKLKWLKESPSEAFPFILTQYERAANWWHMAHNSWDPSFSASPSVWQAPITIIIKVCLTCETNRISTHMLLEASYRVFPWTLINLYTMLSKLENNT